MNCIRNNYMKNCEIRSVAAECHYVCACAAEMKGEEAADQIKYLIAAYCDVDFTGIVNKVVV